jgi:hypothetical protein
MIKNDIKIFRGYENTSLDFFGGYSYTYNYRTDQSPKLGSGLNPAALASAKVIGKTFRSM